MDESQYHEVSWKEGSARKTRRSDETRVCEPWGSNVRDNDRRGAGLVKCSKFKVQQSNPSKIKESHLLRNA